MSHDVSTADRTCVSNRFCSSVPLEDREKLCAICRKQKIVRGQLLPNEHYQREMSLVLSGGIVTVKNHGDKVQFLYTESDIIGSDSFMRKSAPVPYDFSGRVEVFKDGEIACFPFRELERLFLTRPLIAKALFLNLSTVDTRRSFYTIEVLLSDAYHAVLYMMLYAEKHGLGKLTHEELAFLTNLSRVTVTKALGKIARTEHFGDLDSYLRSTEAFN